MVLVLYGSYLPFSGYGPGHIFFDAGEYWELSTQFFQQGRFDFWGFRGPGRGYVGPGLLLPGRLLCKVTGCSILTASRVLGVGWAVTLFGAVLPAVWRQVSGRALSGGRWLGLLGLGFALWRDHFNFPLTDFPAFTLLLLGLLALAQPKPLLWLGAGWALGACVNLRPLYAAAVPVWFALAIYANRKHVRQLPAGLVALVAPGTAELAGRPVTQARLRWLALALGAALVLGPQALLNLRHAGQATPFVLVSQHDARRDFLHSLSWGTRVQRYETGFFPGPHRVLLVPDSVGIRQIKSLGPGGFASYGEYLTYVMQQPASVARRYARHLFNGLDLWYPTPYSRRVQGPFQAAFQGLNFAALGLALVHLLVVVRGRWRGKVRLVRGLELLVGAAVLLPVMVAVTSHVEPRYFLPLHLPLLLLAATARPLRWAGLRPRLRPLRLLLALFGAALWLAGCWQLSRSTQRLAEFDRTDLMR